jgi:hypothetical protein
LRFFHLPGRFFNAAHEDISKLADFSPSFLVFRAPAQYVTLQEYFSHPSFSYLLFSNPTRKTAQIHGRLLIAIHVDQSNYLATTRSKSEIISIPGPWKKCIFLGPQQPSVGPLDMTAARPPRFPMQAHILSTSGAALMRHSDNVLEVSHGRSK